MALIQVNFLSDTLKRTVPFQVILPVDKIPEDGKVQSEARPFKTLYLLHGLIGNYTDWVTNTTIQLMAEARNLAVVMPSGENSFYIEQPIPNNDFGKYVGEELVSITRKMFPLSHKREDTYIAGLSMGGFGAIRNGLKYYDTFGYIAGLSSALHIFESPDGRTSPYQVTDCFGDLDEAVRTDKNPRIAMERLIAARQRDSAVQFPKMYMACGLQDDLLESNRSFKEYLLDKGVDVTYEETPGIHDWNFWQCQIEKVLNWLPLDRAEAGVGSGNVPQAEGR